LQADNARNNTPVLIIVRVHAGFDTGPNITWLLEMGYTVYTKAHNAQVTARMRSQGGIARQEQSALFAANFVRWTAVCLRQRVRHSTPRFDDALTRVKTMVRVAANTNAWVIAAGDSLLVRFDETGAYLEVELRLDGPWQTCPPILPHKKVQNHDFGDGFSSGCT
jgi:hypothetical protein